MGLLRLALALSVFFAHTAPQQITSFIDALYSVQIFFMLSGFLIAYILTINMQYRNSYRNFYINRFLKIYPIYYLILLLTLFIFAVNHTGGFPWKAYFLEAFSHAGSGWKIFIVLVNGLLFGIDITKLIHPPHFQIVNCLVIPPAWSLGLEVLFYLIAPFILGTLRRTITFFVASLVIKFYILSLGTSFYTQWTMPFFPSELSFFLLGALSYQILYPTYLKASANKVLLLSMLGLTMTCIASVILLGLWTKLQNYYLLAYILFLFFVLPMSFIFSNQFKWDRFLGEISFPLYLIHILLFNEVDYILRTYLPHYYYPNYIPYITLTFSFAASLGIIYLIGSPLEKLRAKRKYPQSGTFVNKQPIVVSNPSVSILTNDANTLAI